MIERRAEQAADQEQDALPDADLLADDERADCERDDRAEHDGPIDPEAGRRRGNASCSRVGHDSSVEMGRPEMTEDDGTGAVESEDCPVHSGEPGQRGQAVRQEGGGARCDPDRRIATAASGPRNRLAVIPVGAEN